MLSQEMKIRIKKTIGRPVNKERTDSVYDKDAVDECLSLIIEKIEKAKKIADTIIVLPHIGGQFNDCPGACANYIMDCLCDSGVDAIIASHPHVVQKCEIRKNTLIAYSLGNYSMSPNSIYLLHDYKPEYAIMLHLYLTNEGIRRHTFSILKIEENDFLKVIPVEKLMKTLVSAEKREQLMADVAFVYKRFLGKEYPYPEILEEYEF